MKMQTVNQRFRTIVEHIAVCLGGWLPILQFAQTGGCCTSTICQEVVMTSMMIIMDTMMIIMDTMMIIMDKYDHHHGHNDDDHHGHDDHGGVDTKSLVEFKMSHILEVEGMCRKHFQHF